MAPRCSTASATHWSIYQDDVDPPAWLRHNVGHNLGGVAPASASSGEFVLATFNVLGHSHTMPGGSRTGWAASGDRMHWAVQLLDQYSVDVVGLQEFQRPQKQAFLQLAGDRRGQRLRERPRPRRHRAVPPPARFRLEAIRREVALIREPEARYQVPIYLTGDMNDRDLAFCGLTAGGLLQAAAGGSNDQSCQPPAFNGIDWILGTSLTRFAGQTVVRDSLVSKTTDHPLVLARATSAGS